MNTVSPVDRFKRIVLEIIKYTFRNQIQVEELKHDMTAEHIAHAYISQIEYAVLGKREDKKEQIIREQYVDIRKDDQAENYSWIYIPNGRWNSLLYGLGLPYRSIKTPIVCHYKTIHITHQLITEEHIHMTRICPHLEIPKDSQSQFRHYAFLDNVQS